MKKIIFIISILFLLSGCTSSYNLEIKNDEFIESIDVKILNEEIPSSEVISEIEVDDQITPFLENKYPAFFSDKEKYYDKTVNYNENDIDVNLSYKYTAEEFKNANSLNTCFNNLVFDDVESYYIHAYGEFYCLYSEEMYINIKTDNKVLMSNAHKIEGNVYSWKIDASNKNDIDIEFEVSKGFPLKSVIKYGSIVLVGVIIILVIYLSLRHINKKNNSLD